MTIILKNSQADYRLGLGWIGSSIVPIREHKLCPPPAQLRVLDVRTAVATT